jgi:hypothetical protein
MSTDIARLEGQIKSLVERIAELEYAVFLDEKPEAEVDPLEAQHQHFMAGVRSRREGNA